MQMINHGLYKLTGILVEGKPSMCLICMKYRITILIIIIISLGQIFFYRILQTHYARAHARTRARPQAHACARTRVHIPRRRRRTGYRYSVAPSRDGPLRWRQCRSLAIEINTGSGGPVSPRCWVFFAYKKNLGRTETLTRDSLCCQSIRTV